MQAGPGSDANPKRASTTAFDPRRAQASEAFMLSKFETEVVGVRALVAPASRSTACIAPPVAFPRLLGARSVATSLILIYLELQELGDYGVDRIPG